MGKGSKSIAIIALIVAVVGLGIGFAAFSSTLTISSSATVTPNASDFKVIFTNYASSACTTTAATSVTGTGTGAGTATVSGTTLSGVSAAFTAPGQTATYQVCAHNAGQYTAYLKSVSIGAPTCTPGSGATAALVTEACKSIRVTVQPGTTIYSTSNSSITSHSLAKGATELINVKVEYLSSGARADGPFTVTFGNTVLTYRSTD